MTTTFYTIHNQPTIEYTADRHQIARKLLFGCVLALFTLVIAKNACSALIRNIYGKSVELASKIGEVTEIIGAIVRGTFYAVPQLYKSAIVIVAWQVAVCCLESVEVVL